MPKTGRPVKGSSKRDRSFQMRISEEDLRTLDFCAESLGISRTDVVCKGIGLVKKELDEKEK